jgi:hypothetical protein
MQITAQTKDNARLDWSEGGACVASPMRLDVVELIAFMLKIVTVAVTKAVATMMEIWRIFLSFQR